MTTTPMQIIADANKANVEAIQAMAASTFGATQRVAALNLDSMCAALEFAARYTRPPQGEEWQGLLSRQASEIWPATERAVNYLRHVQDISSEAQKEIAQVLAARTANATDSMIAMLDNLEHSAPTGSVPAVSAIKSVLANAQAAYDNMLQTTGKIVQESAAAAAEITTAPVAKAKKATSSPA